MNKNPKPLRDLQRSRVTVMDLRSATTQTFVDLTPSQAVMTAHLQDNKKYKTDQYPKEFKRLYPDLSWGEKTVACCNFSTYLDQSDEDKWDSQS